MVAVCLLVLSGGGAFAEEMAVPQTAAEHEAKAKQYREQAAQYKKVVEEHRAMAAAYARANPDLKTIKNPWNEKMQKHCNQLAADAEKLAADAEKAADFHSLRAKEVLGK
jgi:hypothetical protein